MTAAGLNPSSVSLTSPIGGRWWHNHKNSSRRFIVVEKNKKVLRRSRTNRVLGGVCGGLGEFFGLSPTWFRLGFILLALPGGLPGILPYLLFWIIIPKAGA